jgi:hypothetical protein
MNEAEYRSISNTTQENEDLSATNVAPTIKENTTTAEEEDTNIIKRSKEDTNITLNNKVKDTLEHPLNSFKHITSELIEGDLSNIHQWVNTVSYLITHDVRNPQEIIERGMILINTVITLKDDNKSIEMNNDFIDTRYITILGGIAIGNGLSTAPIGIALIIYTFINIHIIKVYIHRLSIPLLALSMVGLLNTHVIVSLYSSLACFTYYKRKEVFAAYFMFLMATFMFDELPDYITWGICGYGVVLTTNS